jgi:hypothetical protein
MVLNELSLSQVSLGRVCLICLCILRFFYLIFELFRQRGIFVYSLYVCYVPVVLFF